MNRETSKARQSRIDLDYYRQPTPATRWKIRLGLAAFALAAIWAGLAPGWTTSRPLRLFQWDRLATPGQLASPHQLWNEQCEACHVPFRPVSPAHSRLDLATTQTTTDQKCQTCHKSPAHHASQPDVGPSCADCHQDHQGITADLISQSDHQCVECHQDVSAHRKANAGPLTIANRVVLFDPKVENHPVFDLQSEESAGDPGRLAFNHERHLSPGMPQSNGGDPILVYGQLPEAARARYGWTPDQPLDAPVRMTCAMCHVLDPADASAWLGVEGSPAGAAPRNMGGAYFLPISYENHCRSCHPTPFDADDPTLQAPHGVQPAEVLATLRRLYAEQVVEEDPALLQRVLSPRPLPGKSSDSQDSRVVDRLNENLVVAARLLFSTPPPGAPADRGGCLLCHQTEAPIEAIVGPQSLEAIEAARIAPPDIPSVWFSRARFDHTAHRGVTCLSCHEKTDQSPSRVDVLIPGKSLCLNCHAPTHSTPEAIRGGAGHSCVECHRYHGGDHPDQGRGSWRSGPSLEREIREFLEPGSSGSF